MEKKISRIIYLFKTKSFIRHLLAKIRSKDFSTATKAEVEERKGLLELGYKINLSNPKTFNEKIIWLKLNYKNYLWERCADKYEMKNFLKENGFGKYVPRVVGGPYKNSKEIDLNKLPEKFVLKTNHDCGSIFVCEKGKSNFSKIFNALDASIAKKYSSSRLNNEWVYDSIKPIIFAEELLVPYRGNDLCDYKFIMQNGNPIFMYVASRRSKDVRFSPKYINYSDCPFLYTHLKDKKLPPEKPKFYDEMVDVSKKISKILNFVRVDWYSTTEGPKIGELTFFSMSGHGMIYPIVYDKTIGDKVDISFALKQNF